MPHLVWMSIRSRSEGLARRNAPINVILMVIIAISIIYPFWNLLIQSLNEGYANPNELRFWPARFTTVNYTYVLGNQYIWSGYRETLIRTILGTFLSLIATMCGAYVGQSHRQYLLRQQGL